MKNTLLTTVKSLILFILLMVGTGLCFANVLPVSSEEIPTDAIGLYQADGRITIYEKPDCTSDKLFDYKISYSDYTHRTNDNLFAVIIPSKKLCYLYSVDISDDEQWIKVIYDKSKKLTGWVYKNDDFQFLPWMDFFSLYGRKYGLLKLKSAYDYNEIYSNPSEDSQVINKLQNPKHIRLTAVEGNWALVSVLEYNSSIFTGYIRWRNDKGNILLFPNIK